MNRIGLLNVLKSLSRPQLLEVVFTLESEHNGLSPVGWAKCRGIRINLSPRHFIPHDVCDADGWLSG